MRIHQKGNLHQLTFLPRVFPVNCYLFEETEELTLIDCALPYSDQAILKTADQIGKPITRILLTHADDDHIGALDKLKTALPTAKVMMSIKEAQWVGKHPTTDKTTPVNKKPTQFNTKADQLLTENDQIGSLRVIETLGHTPGSISFYHEESRTLIAGDALQTRGGVAVAGDTRWLFPFPAIFTWHKELALESAKKIAKLQPSLLAIGHGNMLSDATPMMKKVITRAEKKWKKGANHVSTNGAS